VKPGYAWEDHRSLHADRSGSNQTHDGGGVEADESALMAVERNQRRELVERLHRGLLSYEELERYFNGKVASATAQAQYSTSLEPRLGLQSGFVFGHDEVVPSLPETVKAEAGR